MDLWKTWLLVLIRTFEVAAAWLSSLMRPNNVHRKEVRKVSLLLAQRQLIGAGWAVARVRTLIWLSIRPAGNAPCIFQSTPPPHHLLCYEWLHSIYLDCFSKYSVAYLKQFPRFRLNIHQQLCGKIFWSSQPSPLSTSRPFNTNSNKR